MSPLGPDARTAVGAAFDLDPLEAEGDRELDTPTWILESAPADPAVYQSGPGSAIRVGSLGES